jgi:hypothetical protein
LSKIYEGTDSFILEIGLPFSHPFITEIRLLSVAQKYAY